MRRISGGGLPRLRSLARNMPGGIGHLAGVFGVHDFRQLWVGQMISFVGDALAFNTMTLAIIRMANDAGMSSGKLLSAVFVLAALPALFIGMVAGTLVDRWNRKHIMIAADLLRALIVLGYLLVRDVSQVWIFVVVTVALSSVSIFFYPARTALLPTILDRDQLLAANGLSQLTHTLAFVVGAAAAGVLVGMADATAPAFVIDSATFVLSAFFIARMATSGQVSRPAPAATTSSTLGAPSQANPLQESRQVLVQLWAELREGVRYAAQDPVMRGVLISFLALMSGLGAANVTFVPLLINELGMREEGLGLIRLSQTAGILLGSAAVTTTLAARYPAANLIGASMLTFGITTIIVSVVREYALMVGVLFLVGLVIAPPQIVASTLMQRHVPSSRLGRASSAQGTVVNVANIASMGAAGLLMDGIGARLVFAIAGMLICAAGIVSWRVLRGVGTKSRGGGVGDVYPAGSATSDDSEVTASASPRNESAAR